jgi:hypothetical protein
MAQVSEKIVNGVNVTALQDTIEQIKKKKDIAKFTFKAQNKWIGGTANKTTVSDITEHARSIQGKTLMYS